MGSRSELGKSYANLGVIEPEVAKEDKSDYNSPEEETVSASVKTSDVTLAFTRGYKLVVEIPGGRTLTFNGAGSEVKVSQKEAEYLLGLKSGRGCCGGQRSSPLFILVGGKLWV